MALHPRAISSFGILAVAAGLVSWAVLFSMNPYDRGGNLVFFMLFVAPAILLGFMVLTIASFFVPKRRAVAPPPIAFEASATLHMAAAQGNVKALTTLLAHGEHVDATNSLGQTPLMGAALYGHSDAVRSLLLAGANNAAVDNDGRSVSDYARDPAIATLVRSGASGR